MINIIPALCFNMQPVPNHQKGLISYIFMWQSLGLLFPPCTPVVNKCVYSWSGKELWLTASTKWHMWGYLRGSFLTEVKLRLRPSPILICSSLNVSSTLSETPFTWKLVYSLWPPPMLDDVMSDVGTNIQKTYTPSDSNDTRSNNFNT